MLAVNVRNVRRELSKDPKLLTTTLTIHLRETNITSLSHMVLTKHLESFREGKWEKK
jgi:hypothetical protein